MPTYDYICRSCGHEMETFQSIKADPLVDCPSCSTPELQRRIGGGAGIIFKGSGFYQTDYKSSSGGESKPASATAEKAGSATSSSSKSESAAAKPATASTPTSSSS